MIIVKLMGGLGNQMFQYAIGRNLAIKNNTELFLDLSFLLDRTPQPNFVFRDYDLDLFPVKAHILNKEESEKIIKYIPNNRLYRIPYSSKILNFIIKIRSGKNIPVIKDKNFNFHPEILELKGNMYLDGWWQCSKYFESIKSEIKKTFNIKPELNIESENLFSEIRKNNSVCINIRRGDFVTIANTTKFHGFHGIEYVNQAADYITKRTQEPHFYIFSDDIEWCQENIKLNYPTTFIDHNFAGKKFSGYLYLMSQCKHYIIPNSTFAWWAAWLNEDPNKIVVAPKKWFANTETDIVPDEWIKI